MIGAEAGTENHAAGQRKLDADADAGADAAPERRDTAAVFAFRVVCVGEIF